VKRTLALSACLISAIATVATSPPSAAYDKDAYSYAAGHMIDRSDVPLVLGILKKTMAFSAYPSNFPLFLCSVPNAEPTAPSRDYSFPAGVTQFSATYNAKAEDGPSVEVAVNQYSSAEKAIKAFDKAKAKISGCDGTGSTTWTDPSTGAVTTYSTQITNGVVPAVTTTGVESLFVSSDNLSATVPGDSKFINDTYTVLSLVDDVVIITTYYVNGNDNPTKKQRKAVNQVAFNAETAWLS
jgi:hypothetical protein